MKSTSVVAITLLAVAAAAGCSKSDPSTPGETNTTSAPVEQADHDRDRDKDMNRPVEPMGGTVSGTTETTGADTPITKAPRHHESDPSLGKDGVKTTSPMPLTEREGDHVGPGSLQKGKDAGTTVQKSSEQKRNTSTTLGDGTSGTYTGGEGTYGGKATHGTGTKAPDSHADANKK